MHVDLIAAYTAGIRRARQEYADHPFAVTGCHAGHNCAWRRLRAARKAQEASGGALGPTDNARRSTGRNRPVSEREAEK